MSLDKLVKHRHVNPEVASSSPALVNFSWFVQNWSFQYEFELSWGDNTVNRYLEYVLCRFAVSFVYLASKAFVVVVNLRSRLVFHSDFIQIQGGNPVKIHWVEVVLLKARRPWVVHITPNVITVIIIICILIGLAFLPLRLPPVRRLVYGPFATGERIIPGEANLTDSTDDESEEGRPADAAHDGEGDSFCQSSDPAGRDTCGCCRCALTRLGTPWEVTSEWWKMPMVMLVWKGQRLGERNILLSSQWFLYPSWW